MQILQSHCFGADVASAQRVGLVAFDGDNVRSLGFNHESTDGLAQMASTVMCFMGHKSTYLNSSSLSFKFL
jgi:hypothetical protein